MMGLIELSSCLNRLMSTRHRIIGQNDTRFNVSSFFNAFFRKKRQTVTKRLNVRLFVDREPMFAYSRFALKRKEVTQPNADSVGNRRALLSYRR